MRADEIRSFLEKEASIRPLATTGSLLIRLHLPVLDRHSPNRPLPVCVPVDPEAVDSNSDTDLRGDPGRKSARRMAVAAVQNPVGQARRARSAACTTG